MEGDRQVRGKKALVRQLLRGDGCTCDAPDHLKILRETPTGFSYEHKHDAECPFALKRNFASGDTLLGRLTIS